MASLVSKVQSNLLAAAFSTKDRALLANSSSVVQLRTGSVLVDRGERVRFVYFPLDCVLSLLATADQYSMVEVAMVGREGVAGYIDAVGGRVAGSRILVIHGGEALRIPIAAMLDLVDASSAVRMSLNNYLFAYISQLAQTVACTRFHQIEARLARWLLMANDRSAPHGLSMTQDKLSILLGVRRVGISAAAAALKTRKLIEYTRGKLRVTNRVTLETEACACYRVDLATYDRILGNRRVKIAI
jgi:CRP-like cAMP-binding protein